MTTFNCDQLFSKLDEMIDGDLGEPDATAARSHLETCTSCRAQADDTKRLLASARLLPRSVDPDRDLWPGIAGAINTNRVVRGGFDRPAATTGRRLWLAAAAAAILVVSVSLAYMAGVERGRPRSAEAPVVNPSYMEAAYDGLATDLEEVRNQLRSSLDQRQDELTPETWSVVMDNLMVIDNAIERIEIALAENPEDGRLNRQLSVAYRRQIDLLQRATLLPAEI